MIYKCICEKQFDSLKAYNGHKSHCQCCKELKQKELKIKKEEEAFYEFPCECGRYFKTLKSRNSHARFCDQYVNKNFKYDENGNYKITSPYYKEGIWKCDCGKEFNNGHSLSSHFRHCDIHRELIGLSSDKHYVNKGEMAGWGNKTKEEVEQYRKQANITYRERIESGEIIPQFTGKHHTEETKQKIRESTINYLLTHIGGRTRYNKNACIYIDKLNQENNWNLQHAENGGEVQIAGYYLDGYDKNLNIAFEYDEPNHYKGKYKDQLKEKDIKRQNIIKAKLGCKFYRYNEILDKFYEV